MKSIFELHKEHNEWLSDMDFLQREIVFFRSLAEKFEKEINDLSFIESLEAYKSTFEKISSKLNKHRVEIEFSEKRLKEAIQFESTDVDAPVMENPVHIRLHIDELIEEVKLLKDSMYDLVAEAKKLQKV